ncbi:MAG TPA: metallophosphoesterase [Rhodopila sp.]|nr:metallophosphoesterase [Rhodopila sp.]
MRRPVRRLPRAAPAEVATFSGPRAMAREAGAIRFLRAPGWLPRGRRVYAVGDIHGQRDSLAALHGIIAEDMARRPVGSSVIVYLGDFINQGPDSAGVLDLVAGGPPVAGMRVVGLMGDHERMLLDALAGDRPSATDFLWSGGRATLAGWGIDPDLPGAAWAAGIPAAHLAWLRSLRLTHREGGYLFVHAGIRPGVPAADQAREDLVSMRQPFLSSEQDFGAVVVHGHSSAPSVHIGENRIGLDTGAGIGGRLSCAVLEDDVIGLCAA